MSYPLKYLFSAIYEDGSLLFQGPDDQSKNDPSKSAFFDVDHKRLVRFELHGDGHVYAIHLRNAVFFVDDAPFVLHDPYMPLFELELRYFRDVGQLRVMGGEDRTIVYYCIGFRAKGPDGQVIEHVLRVA